MLREESAKLAPVIFNLLRQATSQQVVKDFLKAKGVPVSAQNWDELFSRRIQPALEERIITIEELRGLLQEAEEYGKQHTFLYQCDPELAQKIISRNRVEKIAGEQDLINLLNTPLDLELPERPTIVDIRISPPEDERGAGSLLIKIVETRVTKILLSESTDEAAARYTKTYAVNRKRAVNIAYLRENGLLELRVASQDNQSRYHENVRELQAQISKFIPRDGFSAISLSNAKAVLLKDRTRLANEVRYSNSTARNAFGYVLNLGSSSQSDDLSSDDGSMAAIETFLENEGQITGTNIYLKIPGTDPVREIHLLVSGEVNEFAVPVSCSSGDYDYVLRKILTLNQ